MSGNDQANHIPTAQRRLDLKPKMTSAIVPAYREWQNTFPSPPSSSSVPDQTTPLHPLNRERKLCQPLCGISTSTAGTSFTFWPFETRSELLFASYAMSRLATITRENVTTLFPDVHTRLIGEDLEPTASLVNGSNDISDLAGYDEEQIRLMDEVCIVLDDIDQPIGSASKKACHLMTNIDNGLLHRAFSCFLFDPTTKKLLLQQRATEKITFPNMWTNTCCSHPLAHPAEAGKGDLVSNVDGAKRAAIRKLNHELGIKNDQVPFSDFNFLTRIHYLAPSDGKWGEHEIDYILFIEADVTLDINKNEVQDTRWVSADELRQMFNDVETQTGSDKALKYTPWFRLICEGMLFKWWDALISGKLQDHINDTQIRRM